MNTNSFRVNCVIIRCNNFKKTYERKVYSLKPNVFSISSQNSKPNKYSNTIEIIWVFFVHFDNYLTITIEND